MQVIQAVVYGAVISSIKWLCKPQDAMSPASRPYAHDLLFYSTEFGGVRYLRKTLRLSLEETTDLLMNWVRW